MNNLITKEYYARITNPDFNPESLLSGLSSIALFIAGLLSVVFIVLSMVLDHHWKEHGVTEEQIKKLRRVYFSGAGVLFFIMLISLLSFLL